MEIKVICRGQEVGHIDFNVFTAIEKFRDYGYATFSIRSIVNKYNYFAFFKNESTEKIICLYPNGSFSKNDNSTVPYDELLLIKDIIDSTYYEINNSEDSE